MKNAMKASVYVACTALVFAGALLVLILCNYAAERLWSENDVTLGHINIIRPFDAYNGKARYLSQPNLPYNAFIFGGSKACALHPATLAEKTGLTFYNYWNLSGTFEDYERYLHFVTDIYSVDTIILHLSSHEVYRDKSQYILPPEMQSNLKLRQRIFLTAKSILATIKEDYVNVQHFIDLFHERKNTDKITHRDGSRHFEFQKQRQSKNPAKYLQRYVLHNYNDCIARLFSAQEPQGIISCAENLVSLRRIQSYCEEAHIRLVVIIGPTFISELYKYASQEYIDYLKDMVSICSVWNFGGIHELNRNPYNFADDGHYFDFVGDVIIDTVFARQDANTGDMDAFGILLSPDNIDAFIASQKEKWRALKAQYDLTGAIPLGTQEDASYLGWQ